ncbi:hypothetical protein [Hymenobacter rubripertinctus]|uniref:hypothetical protein n=1 Tax=Hymenobacter rubripertinctus TaxID=2029981 RepID=UPI00160034E9|nr:hypothetical protein [Hymenobacter rubripertinctus]
MLHLLLHLLLLNGGHLGLLLGRQVEVFGHFSQLVAPATAPGSRLFGLVGSGVEPVFFDVDFG